MAAAFLSIDHLSEPGIDDGVEHDAGLFLDVLEHPHELLFRTDQRVDVLDGAGIHILRGDRPTGGEKRFAGGVGDQVKVKEALRFVHSGCTGLWADVDNRAAEARAAQAECIRCPLVHNWASAALLSPDNANCGENPGSCHGSARASRKAPGTKVLAALAFWRSSPQFSQPRRAIPG